MKKTLRGLAAILTVIMVITVIPISASADDGVVEISSLNALKSNINKNNAVLKLTADIAVNDDYDMTTINLTGVKRTLNLNGHNITGYYYNKYSMFSFEEYAELIIKDSAGGGSIYAYSSSSNHKNAFVTDVPYGAALTIESGTFNFEPDAAWLSSGVSVTDNGDGTYTVGVSTVVTHTHDFQTKTKWINAGGAYKAVFTDTCSCGETEEPVVVSATYVDANGIRTYTATYGQTTVTMEKQIEYTVNYDEETYTAHWGEAVLLTSRKPCAWYIGSVSQTNKVADGTMSYRLIVTSDTIVITRETDREDPVALVRTTLTSTEAGKAVYNAKWTIPSQEKITVKSAKIYRGYTANYNSNIDSSKVLSSNTVFDTGLNVQHGDYTLRLSDLTSGKYQYVVIQIIYTVGEDTTEYELTSDVSYVQVQ